MKGKREKKFSTIQYNFYGVIYEQSEVIYLHRDYVTEYSYNYGSQLVQRFLWIR